MNTDQRTAIIKAWLGRAKNLGYTNPKSAKYLRAQAEFVCGAMTADNLINGADVDPGFTVCVMCGDCISTLLPKPADGGQS